MARLRFLSSALAGSVFAATATFGVDTGSVNISSWGGDSDSTPPSLGLPTGTAAGPTGAVGTVETTEGNGTIYWAVTTSSTAPSIADIKSGAGAASFNSFAAFSPGVKTTSPAASGLSPSTTYYFHFVHTDLAGNDSNVATSAAFTTDALGSGTGSVTISVESRMSTQVAPEAIAFRAGVTGATVSEPGSRNDYDPTAHSLVYVWDFGDPTGAQSDKVVNLPTTWNNMNKGEGKYPIHVYDQPGTYTVTCTVYELSGILVGSNTFSVTVLDPDTVFAGPRTIVVAADSDFTGAPAGSTQETNIADALQAMVDQAATCRILLKRGESYTIPGTQIAIFGFHPNVYFEAWGTGARPILQGTASTTPGFIQTYSSFAGKDLVFRGIKWQGTWDSENEVGNSNGSALALDRANCVVTDCEMDGVNSGMAGGAQTGDGRIWALHNSVVTNFVNFAINTGANGGIYTGVIGNALFHSLQANEGLSGSSGGPGNRHAAIRLPCGPTQYISGNDLFSRSGWAGVAQPPLRPVSTVRAEEVTYCHIARNAMEGGDLMIQATHNSGSVTTIGPVNLVVEDNLGVGTFHTRGFMATQYTGVTTRNNLFVLPNVPRYAWPPTTDGFFYIKDWGGLTILHPNDPHVHYNNTVIIQLDDTNRDGRPFNFATTDAGSRWTAFDQRNNVLQAPNALSQQSENALLTIDELATVGGTWTSRMLGRKYGSAAVNQNPPTQLTMNSAFATPTSGVVFDYRPGPSSPLIDDADVALTTVFDGLGNQAGSFAGRDRGWLER